MNPGVKGAPPVSAAAAGPQTVSAYKPTNDEILLIERLYEEVGKMKIRRDVVNLIECAQYQKATGGITIMATEAERALVLKIAKDLQVQLRFWN